MRCVLVAAMLAAVAAAQALQPEYYRHFVFDNSITPDNYFHSSARSIGPSSLAAERGRLPIERRLWVSGPNSLRLSWRSQPGGTWEAEIRPDRWRGNEIWYEGDMLMVWCYSDSAIPAALMPRVQLTDRTGGFTEPLRLEGIAAGVAARTWMDIRIPLSRFRALSREPLDVHKLGGVYFVQGEADGAEHTLLIDDIRIDFGSRAPGPPPAVPSGVKATGYERHVSVSWTPAPGPQASRFIIYRSADGVSFEPVASQEPRYNRYEDWVGEPGRKYWYKVKAADLDYRESPFSQVVSASTRPMTDEELLTMVQEASFRYYWEGADPGSGMALENIPGDSGLIAGGASGFGIMAILAGVERGFVTRDDAMDRLLRITSFLEKADRFHGAWPHFIDVSGRVLPLFGKYDNGADLVETSFLVQGLLAARGYFSRNNDRERELVRRITALWESVEWDWFRGPDPKEGYLYWHWSPDFMWHIGHPLIGFNETMVTYLLAIASPTHGVPASIYYSGWASQSDFAAKYRSGWGGTKDGDHYANGNTYYGITLPVGVGTGGPLFFTHYSFMGFDPHVVRDRYANYFENSRAISLINRAYCVANPKKYAGYGESSWGLTASDNPFGYSAQQPIPHMDNGTISPTAALSAYAYTPAESLAALKHFYRDLGDRLWGPYGFHDAFNISENWFARTYLALDQAPIVAMIENGRSGAVWRAFMSNPEMRPALERIAAESASAGGAAATPSK